MHKAVTNIEVFARLTLLETSVIEFKLTPCADWSIYRRCRCTQAKMPSKFVQFAG